MFHMGGGEIYTIIQIKSSQAGPKPLKMKV
jgi:hypothetical protein